MIGQQYKNLLNLTFTYRSDSSITNAFGRLKPKTKEAAKVCFYKLFTNSATR